MSVGMPAGIWLHKYGVLITDYFGHVPYHVGSSLLSKEWRDVDVRLMLDDNEFTERFGKIKGSEVNPRLSAITLAFATLGEKMTGLPIDFQIQPVNYANEKYSGPRSALVEIRGVYAEGHEYLSTGCLHDEHDYCKTEARRYDGTIKVAGTCKFCAAPCICGCHESDSEPALRSVND